MPKIKSRNESVDKIIAAIRCRMAYCNMTQAELAKRTGISTSTLSDRLNRPGDMRLYEIVRISTALKIEPEKLLRGEVQ